VKNKLYILLLFLVFFIPRIIGLGSDIYGVDAGRWDIRSDNFVNAVLEKKYIETYEQYHPGVTVMWLTGFSKKYTVDLFEKKNGYIPKVAAGVYYPEQFRIFLVAAKLPLILTSSFLFSFAFYLLSKININKKYLLIAASITSLEPFFLGITKYYHLSGLESALAFALIIFILYYKINKIKKFYILIAGILLGLAFLTKISAIILLPFIGLELFILETINTNNIWNLKNLTKSFFISILEFLTIIVTSIVIFYALFPAMWVDPKMILQKIIEEGGQDTAFGDVADYPFFTNKYLYYYEMFLTRSLGLTFITFVTSLTLFAKTKSKNTKLLLITAVLFIIYFCLIMSFPSKLKDRYLITAFPFFTLVSSFSIYYVLAHAKKLKLILITLVISTYYLIILFAYFPTYSAFYSDLLGGISNYSKHNLIINRGEYYLTMINYLNEKDGKDAYKNYLRIYDPEKNRSTPGYKGTVITYDSASGKSGVKYRASSYDDLYKVPVSSCKLIKTFGPKGVFKFDYLYLFEC